MTGTVVVGVGGVVEHLEIDPVDLVELLHCGPTKLGEVGPCQLSGVSPTAGVTLFILLILINLLINFSHLSAGS